MANYNKKDTIQAASVLISRLYKENTNERVKDILDGVHFRTKNDVYENTGFLEYLVKSTPAEEKQRWEVFFEKQLDLNNKLIGQLEDLMKMVEEQTQAKNKKIMDVLGMV